MAELSRVFRKDYDRLISGPREWLRTMVQPLTASSGDLKRGCIMTYDVDTKKLKPVTSKNDVVFGILVEDTPNNDAEADVVVYVAGAFNINELSTGTVTDSSNVSDYFLSARQNNLFFETPRG